MTPRALDPEVVQAKLRHIDRLRRDLEAMGPMSPERLEGEDITRHAAEWILTQVAQLSSATAAYLAVRAGDQVPVTYADALRALGTAAIVEPPLASRLAALAGMRNVLVHRYDDIDLVQVAAALQMLPEDATAFVRQVTRHLRTALGEG